MATSAYDCEVPARGKALVKTDIQIELPTGCYGRIAPRSGLAWKNFIDVGGKFRCTGGDIQMPYFGVPLILYLFSAGVIDEDYRGNVGVVLFNHSDSVFQIKRGDRIAQLICERIFYPVLKEIQVRKILLLVLIQPLTCMNSILILYIFSFTEFKRNSPRRRRIRLHRCQLIFSNFSNRS